MKSRRSERVTAWASVRDVAAEAGRSDHAVRAAGKAGRFRTRKRDGRLELDLQGALAHFRRVDDAGQGRPAGTATPRAAGQLTAGEFAARAGINERNAHKLKREGRIAGYTESALRQLLAEGEGEQKASSSVGADSNMADLEDATLHDIRRAKEYQQARLAKLKADEAEGKVYSADAVEAKVRRMAQATQAAFRELPMVMPARLGGRDVAEIRASLARWAQDKVEMLASIAGQPETPD
jgi:hypothetical protein